MTDGKAPAPAVPSPVESAWMVGLRHFTTSRAETGGTRAEGRVPFDERMAFVAYGLGVGGTGIVERSVYAARTSTPRNNRLKSRHHIAFRLLAA